jgi:predicted component of type VI protein secretion system
MSINRNAAAVVENTAAFITFDQTVTGGVIGTPTTEQENAGYSLPNVQAAIDDIWTKVLVQPGQVVTTLSGVSPSTVPSSQQSQVVQLTVTGTPAANGNIVVASQNVAVLTTDTQNQVASKIQAVLDALSYISATVVNNVVTYTYTDTGVHPVDNKVENGITLSTKTTTLGGNPGYLGYGSWELLGSETKYTRTFYSWLRVA